MNGLYRALAFRRRYHHRWPEVGVLLQRTHRLTGRADYFWSWADGSDSSWLLFPAAMLRRLDLCTIRRQVQQLLDDGHPNLYSARFRPGRGDARADGRPGGTEGWRRAGHYTAAGAAVADPADGHHHMPAVTGAVPSPRTRAVATPPVARALPGPPGYAGHPLTQ